MEDLDDLPNLDHWKGVMEFTVEQASLLMAMLDPFETNLEHARAGRLQRWKYAHGGALRIVSAIRQGLITPVVCKGYVWDEVHNGYETTMERVLRNVKASDRDAEISLADTIITRASLEGWIRAEQVQIIRRPKPVPAPAAPVGVMPSATIEAKPEPLALPYHGHASDGLDYVDDAIKQFWTTVDPEDPTTVPLKRDVVDYLVTKRGASKNIAEAVDKILRPENMRRVHLKNNKVPTRESQ